MAQREAIEAAVGTVAALPIRRPGRPVGRDELLRSLLARLQQQQQLVLHGARGNGKSTIAATIATVHLQREGRSVLWLPVRMPPLVELVVRIARAYGDISIANADNPLQHMPDLQALLQAQQPLLVLDGDIEQSVLQHFVTSCAAGIPLVVTSSMPLAHGDWRNQPIGHLSPSASLYLFKQKAGTKGNSQDAIIAALSKRLQYAAFPLVMAARSMIIARQSPSEIAAAIDAALDAHDDEPVPATLAVSFAQLNERLQSLLLFLGATIRGEASAPFLNLLSGISPDSIDMSMTILARLYLVERFHRAGGPCYRLHPLVADFLRARAEQDERINALRADILESSRDFLQIHASTEEAMPRLLSELHNLLATAQWAADNDEPALVADLAEALEAREAQLLAAGYGYELRCLQALQGGDSLHFELPLAPQDEPIAAPSSPSLPSPDASAEPPDDRELQAVNIDQLRTALNVASQNNEKDRQLQILKAIARMQIQQGRESEAVATYGDVLEIYEHSADKDGLLETLDTIAGLLVSKASAPAALEQVKLRTALVLARQHDDSPRVLQILEAIGKVQISQGREEDAISSYEEILALHEQNANKAGILEALDMLSGLLTRSNAATSALQPIRRGLRLAEELGDDESIMHLQSTQGDAQRALGAYILAAEAYVLALRIARQRDDRQHEALILYKLGMTYLDDKDVWRAIEMLEDANERFKQQKKRDMEGKVLQGLGEVHVRLSRWSEAVNFHTSALYIARELGDSVSEAAQLRRLGEILISAQRLPEALTRLRQALHVAYEQKNKREIVGIIAELVGLMMRNLFLSSIAELLIRDGLSYNPRDRELLRLQGEVDRAKERAEARGLGLAVVAGTAREYAANAYNFN